MTPSICWNQIVCVFHLKTCDNKPKRSVSSHSVHQYSQTFGDQSGLLGGKGDRFLNSEGQWWFHSISVSIYISDLNSGRLFQCNVLFININVLEYFRFHYISPIALIHCKRYTFKNSLVRKMQCFWFRDLGIVLKELV